MRASDLPKRFQRLLFWGRTPRPEEVPLEQLAAQAREARALLDSDIYVAAYQHRLDELIDALLALDMGDPGNHAQAVALLGRCQQHQQIARDLAATVRRYELEKDRRAPSPLLYRRSGT